jgi:hypothetical protein
VGGPVGPTYSRAAPTANPLLVERDVAGKQSVDRIARHAERSTGRRRRMWAPGRLPEEGQNVRAVVAERRRSSPLASHPARLSGLSGAAQQGPALPARPAHGRGGRRRHAPGRRRRPRRPHARLDRAALARRAAHHRGAHRHRARPRAPRRVDARPPRQGRPPPRRCHGPGGLPPPPLARAPDRDAGRAALVRDRRPHPRAALGERLSPRPTPTRRRQGRRQTAVRAPPLRHAHAIELAHESVPLNVIQRQLGTPTSASPRRVGTGRGVGVAAGPFPRPALRTGRARSRASGSPQDMRWPIATLAVRQRRFPVEWWLGLFRWPPTARGCGGRDSDIGSPQSRRARRSSCLRGWSSGAPNTVA